MSNRLAAEKSPYLLQHADNPVDWYPWSREALERAQREDKPILVSIGYAACHWCHVMEHESFEDEDTAALMNGSLINIKVDREERPDVDAIYMEAVQMLSGQGGWPLNVFLTPDGRPFFGGTYFPAEPRHGLPSWRQVVASVAAAYAERREDVLKNAETLTEMIRREQNLAPSDEPLSPELLESAYASILRQADWTKGGTGGAPKFPQPLLLELLLRLSRRLSDPRGQQLVELTLRRMAEGGIYDQLGGGFHRYSVDTDWLVPHFEKMLYDNALLARVYLYAFQVTKDPFYRRITEETLDYLLREMRSPEGGFYSSEDADSEGVEGKYYVWTVQEVEDVLGPESAALARRHWGIRPEGNFEGRTILTAARSAQEVARETDRPEEEVQRRLLLAREAMLESRSKRVKPATDTKILVSWNGLVIHALAEAGRALDRSDYLDAARKAAEFILKDVRPGGRLRRSYKDGPGEVPAFLEDYAFLAEAVITLGETDFASHWYTVARDLADEMVQRFGAGPEPFFDAPSDLDEPVARPRSFFDNPIPSGNSAAAHALLRLAALTGEEELTGRALSPLRAVRDLLARAPQAFPYLLSALDYYLSDQAQIAVVARPDDPLAQRMVAAVYGRYLPNKVVAVGIDGEIPLLTGREQLQGGATAYVCRNFTCRLPVTEVEALERQLEGLSG